ncbi:Na/Pi cotransporter family protein [Neobacillus sp. DY30]|uniref:Na/Pi cotransporter family protein n=1 Tax=Neobacillus sp. DY30 TaxID=3047871 RepID=UPI0024BF6C7D|nr:Na/Pi cotransporter family protein [Neobacillus sp. DY30]WHX98340.1 Na/Pi cotransporter family protein [Neobacillus sp. DY30]
MYVVNTPKGDVRMNVQEMIFEFIGGLGIFLFGIKYMGDGLQNAAGDRLKNILDRFTTNPFMGVLAGIFITALIQSSSGTTALTVALVSAGFMKLRQAIGVIMGANIGTTVTAFIIGIDIGEYALPIIALGALLLFFFNKRTINSFGQIIFGFGALFLGLELMSGGMKPLRSLEAFQDLTVSMSANPILGVVIGTVFTVIVQSSSATIGILQELFATGAINLKASLPVLFGDNIGTTITAVLAAIGTSLAARRAATVHVMFNLIGTLIFMIFLIPFTKFIGYLQVALNLNPEMTIAFAHGIFNVSNTIIQFPFIGALAWIVTKIIPGEEKYVDMTVQHLNPKLIEHSPSVALGQAKEEILRMGDYAKDGLAEAIHFLNTQDKSNAALAYQYEEAINKLDKAITDYLVEVSKSSLTSEHSEDHMNYMNIIRDIERVGDHTENIIELLELRTTRKAPLSTEALGELNEMFQLTLETLNHALESLAKNDLTLANEVLSKEVKIDRMEKDFRKTHILRLNQGACTGDAGILYVDVISNLERIGDHAVNIAQAVLGEQKAPQ